jgi:hypothetical protein
LPIPGIAKIQKTKNHVLLKGGDMRNLTGSFNGRAVLQTTIAPSDVSNHELNLMEVRGAQKSSDPRWDHAKITYWGTADLVAGHGSQRGYFVNEHADGDRDFGTFEGEISNAAGQVTLDGSWRFTGGTGKLAGLTGNGTYKGRLTAAEVENAWEGSYQLAAKTQAA